MADYNTSSGADNTADIQSDLEILEEGSDDQESSFSDKSKSSRDSSSIDDDTRDAEGGKEGADKDASESEEETGEDKSADKEDEKEGEKDDEKGEDEKVEPIDAAHSRPTIKQIKGKYPNFFKDFPDMRHMLFREGEYSQLFPTIDEAREAAERSEDFERFSELLTSGKKDDFGSFLKGINEAGGTTLVNMAANFLPALYGLDRDMYFKVTSPIAESFLRNAYKRAVSSNDENLKNAALVISQWAFEDMGFATGEKRSPELTETESAPKDDKFEKEKKDFYTAKYNDARVYVGNTARTRLSAEVRKGLDPGGVFNSFTSSLLVKQVLEELGNTLEADSRHMGTMNSLWKQAEKAGFAGNWKDRLLSTYLSRARAAMPAIRQRIRAEALKGQEKTNESVEKTAERSSNRREVGGSGPSGSKSNNRPVDAKQIDWSKTSDMDFLNDKVTLRK